MSPAIMKRWRAFLFSAETAIYAKLGFAESCTMDIDVPVDEYLVVGEFFPADISEGPAVLSDSLTQAWVNNDKLAKLYGPTGAGQTKWNICAYQNVTGPKIYTWAYTGMHN